MKLESLLCIVQQDTHNDKSNSGTLNVIVLIFTKRQFSFITEYYMIIFN